MRRWRVVAFQKVWFGTEQRWSQIDSPQTCAEHHHRVVLLCQPDSACGSMLASACSRTVERPRAATFHVAFTGLAPTWQKDISSHYHCTRTCYEVMPMSVCTFYDQFISLSSTVMCHFMSSWKVCHMMGFPLSARFLPIQMRQALTHCKHTHAQETSRHERYWSSANMGIWRSTPICILLCGVFCTDFYP